MRRGLDSRKDVDTCGHVMACCHLTHPRAHTHGHTTHTHITACPQDLQRGTPLEALLGGPGPWGAHGVPLTPVAMSGV